MFKFWRWVYARLYLQQKRAWGTANQPALTAACGVSLAIACNGITIALPVMWSIGIRPDIGTVKFVGGAGALALVATTYWRYGMLRRADELIGQLQGQSIGRARREEARMWWYVLGSPLLVFVVGFIVGLGR